MALFYALRPKVYPAPCSPAVTMVGFSAYRQTAVSKKSPPLALVGLIALRQLQVTLPVRQAVWRLSGAWMIQTQRHSNTQVLLAALRLMQRRADWLSRIMVAPSYGNAANVIGKLPSLFGMARMVPSHSVRTESF